MLMTAQLTVKQAALIEVLRSMGAGWHSRAAIATAMGKNRLNPLDIAALDELSAFVEIERRAVIGDRPSFAQYEYRLTPKEGNIAKP